MTVVVALALSVLLGLAEASESVLQASGQSVALAVTIAYFACLDTGGRATLGKQRLRLLVVDASGAPHNHAKALLRATAKSVVLVVIPVQAQAIGQPLIGLSIAAMVLLTLFILKPPRTLYDLVLGSLVIQTPQRTR